LKRRVPIWKKEHFADGAVWADGEPFPSQLRADTEWPTSASK
jgi:molybdopterin synthase catalytic subunit